MSKAIKLGDLLPTAPVPVEYETYRHIAYVVQDGYIFGSRDTAQIPKEDMYDIHNRFKYLYPEAWYAAQTKHQVREWVFQKENNRTREIMSLSNGIPLIKDLLQLPIGHIVMNQKVPQEDNLVAAARLCGKYGILSWQPERIVSIGVEGENEIKDIVMPNWRDPNSTPFDYPPREQEFLRFAMDSYSLYKSIIALKTLYLAWKALYWTISSADEEELKRLLPKNELFFSVREYKAGESYDKVDYEKSILNISSRISSYNKVIIEGTKVRVVSEYRNPLEASIGTMLRIISLGKDGLDNRSLEYCERCGAQYIKEHGLQKYCNDCKEPRIQVKAYRERERAKKEKEAQQHGKASKQ